MKKTLAILLVAIIMLTLVGCGGDKKAVEKDLQGTWKSTWYNYVQGKNSTTDLYFSEGEVSFHYGKGDPNSGKYEINTDNNEIICHWPRTDEYSETIFKYQYENGILVLYGSGTGGKTGEDKFLKQVGNK